MSCMPGCLIMLVTLILRSVVLPVAVVLRTTLALIRFALSSASKLLGLASRIAGQ